MAHFKPWQVDFMATGTFFWMISGMSGTVWKTIPYVFHNVSLRAVL